MKEAPGFNLNTVLLGIVLAVAAWTCKTVVDIGRTTSTVVERVAGHELQIAGLKERTATLEKQVVNLEVKTGVMISRSP